MEPNYDLKVKIEFNGIIEFRALSQILTMLNRHFQRHIQNELEKNGADEDYAHNAKKQVQLAIKSVNSGSIEIYTTVATAITATVTKSLVESFINYLKKLREKSKNDLDRSSSIDVTTPDGMKIKAKSKSNSSKIEVTLEHNKTVIKITPLELKKLRQDKGTI